MEEDKFPNHSPDCTLPSFCQVPQHVNSPTCSFNTAVSSTSYLADQLQAQQTIIPPSPSGFPINTSTPTRNVTQRPLQTDAVLHNASLLMTAFSPIRRSEFNCPCLLRSDTVNQRHATAQHIPNRELPRKVKNVLGFETTRDVGSSGQSIKTTQSTPQSAAVRAIANSISAHSTKTWVQKLVRISRQTKHTHKKRVFHVIGITETRFINELDCLHFCTHTNQFMHFSC